MNHCFLKWWWRNGIGIEKQDLWRKVIKAKYSMVEGDWIPNLGKKTAKYGHYMEGHNAN